VKIVGRALCIYDLKFLSLPISFGLVCAQKSYFTYETENHRGTVYMYYGNKLEHLKVT